MKKPRLAGLFTLSLHLIGGQCIQLLAEEAGLSNNPFLSNKINDLHSEVVKLVAKFDTRFATR